MVDFYQKSVYNNSYHLKSARIVLKIYRAL